MSLEELKSIVLSENFPTSWWLKDIAIEVENNISWMQPNELSEWLDLLNHESARKQFAVLLGIDEESVIEFLVALTKTTEDENLMVMRATSLKYGEDLDEEYLQEENS